MRSRTILIAAAVVGAVVPGAYLALGGGTYQSSVVADPCVTRQRPVAPGVDGLAERIVVSTLDGIACEVGSSREELVLALPDAPSRRAYARAHNLDEAQFEGITRKGLERAVDDAAAAGALQGWQATLLRQAARRVPLDTMLDAVDLLG
jgi:hypothetical protein